MGQQKLLMRVAGAPMVDRVLDACRDYDTLLVSSSELAPHIHSRPRLAIVRNTKPDLGMAHSFELANAAIEPENAILVFLADKPLVTADIANAIAARAISAGVDVCFPQRADGIGGHPVFFSANARAYAEKLSGDSLRSLRDDPRLTRLRVPMNDKGAYADVDDRLDFDRLTRTQYNVSRRF